MEKKQEHLLSGDFILALCVAIGVKYLIEWISPCDKVTSSHLSGMTVSCFLMIRIYPKPKFRRTKKKHNPKKYLNFNQLPKSFHH